MTAHRVDINTARERLLELIEEANRGDDVVLTRDDQPVARLVPYRVPQPRFGSAAGLVIMTEDFDEPLDDFTEYMP